MSEWNKNINEAPKDGSTIIGLFDGNEIQIRFAKERKCMLADVAMGAGAFGEGWEDCENGLYVDGPEAWRTNHEQN